jgi:hypothetical protein
MESDLRVIDIERMKGISYDEAFQDEGSLPHWYKSIRNCKVSQLSEGDLARLIRQDFYLDFILIESIERLYKDPILGEQFDGELIEALAMKVDRLFWENNDKCRSSVKELILFIKRSNYIDKYEWLIEDDKAGFIKAVQQLSKNVE